MNFTKCLRSGIISKSFQELQDEKKYSTCAEVVERNNMFHEAWFETFIWYIDIPNYKEINENLIKHILKEQKNSKGIIRSNRLGWHSNMDFTNKNVFDDIRNIIFNSVLKISELLNLDMKAFELVMSEMWANVSSYGHYNLQHSHAGCHWSMVYYIQAPDDCGKIVFSDPRDVAYMIPLPFKENEDRPRGYNSTAWFSPIPGRLIVFPAWLKHEVQPNKIKGNRISLSGNYHYRRRIL